MIFQALSMHIRYFYFKLLTTINLTNVNITENVLLETFVQLQVYTLF